jgi:hypothetical protein
MKFNNALDKISITYTIAVINTVATSTMTVDCCNCVQLGQVTFSISSL